MKLTWTQAKVGCYWNSGNYHICTFSHIEGNKVTNSGFRLYFKRVHLEDFSFLLYAKTAAEDHARYLAEKGEAA